MKMTSARIAIFWNVTLPMRLAYAVDRGHYEIACCNDASIHYGEIRSENEFSRIDKIKLFSRGFLHGLLSKNIPAWFVDSWFVEIKD